MIHAEMQADGFVSTRSSGTAEQLIKEAGMILANVAEAVGRVMAQEIGSQLAAEANVMSEVITLATKCRAKQGGKTS